MTITDTIANTFYNSDQEMGEDLADAINVEIKRLVDAGCKYIQVDEPLFARKPENALNFGIKNLTSTPRLGPRACLPLGSSSSLLYISQG